MNDDRFLLSLADVAGWPPFEPIATALPPPMVAGIPSLQRGLVWDPRRVEMLWDSLFRGFPIGSFVACDKLDESRQSTRGRPGGVGVTHHLLDGQQRAQAIGLGYQDSFANEYLQTGRILWLDLAPSKLDGTRAFLFRVTTRAHPWGYSARDAAGPVGVAKMKESLKLCGAARDENGVYVRPEPHNCWPIEAEAPVPLAWLLANPKMSEGLLARLRMAERPWAEKALRILENQGPAIAKIRKGLHRLAGQRILCDVLSTQGPSEDPVWDAELLFHRMNTGGQSLDSDELAWSLLKATWPELESIVADLKQERRIPEARLVRLAARLPLIEMSNSHLRPRRLSSAVGIAELRKLSADKGGLLAGFLLHGELEKVVRVLARWMTSAGPSNLPLVLQAEICRGSPDAFVLGLWLAQRAAREGTADDLRWARPMQALLSSIRWFSRNASKSVDEITRRVSERGPGPQALQGVLLNLEVDDWPLMAIPRPQLVSAIFAESLAGDPDYWKFSSNLAKLKKASTVSDLARGELVEVDAKIDALKRLFSNREMMLYAQRDWLRRAFPGYDPSDKDAWRDHGRPWDFDHLLPSAAAYYRRFPHRDVLTDWAGSVGNLRAWPREDNRSDGARRPDEKLESIESQSKSFVTAPEFEGFRKGFSATEEVSSGDPNGLLSGFIIACSSRIRRMHAAWWGAKGLSVGYLLDEDPIDGVQPLLLKSSETLDQ